MPAVGSNLLSWSRPNYCRRSSHCGRSKPKPEPSVNDRDRFVAPTSCLSPNQHARTLTVRITSGERSVGIPNRGRAR